MLIGAGHQLWTDRQPNSQQLRGRLWSIARRFQRSGRARTANRRGDSDRAPEWSNESARPGSAALRDAAQDCVVASRPRVARLCALPRARAARERECVAASAAIHGLGRTPRSSWPHVSHPALSRAAGRCTVRRDHRCRCDERRAPPTLRAARLCTKPG
jgi:hypothetical protein